MKKLGFGFMRLPLVNGEFNHVDKQTLCHMVDYFLEKGLVVALNILTIILSMIWVVTE